MTRDAVTRKILGTKRAKGLTWKAIVAEIGGVTGQIPEQANRESGWA